MDKTIEYDASSDDNFESRIQIKIERDSTKDLTVEGRQVGKITKYNYLILQRDKAPIKGSLTRDEVELIHRLYTSEGANLSQRTVSRYFPNFTFNEFKKLLKAFNITKASAPVAPHLLEERSTEELIELTLHNKENDFLRKLEQDRNRITENRLKDLTKEHVELKQKVEDFKMFLPSLKATEKLALPKVVKNGDNVLVVYLSDMHIGASVSSNSIYNNPFDYDIAVERLQLILNYISELATNINCSQIIVCNIGDSLDGYNGQTTRGGHALPQNMSNKEQIKNFVDMMLGFFKQLSLSGKFEKISYYCVGESNHDGDFGFTANKVLEGSLAILNPEIKVEIFEKYMDHFNCKGHTFVLCHGKDNIDVFKNMPLTLNDKTENQINEYIDSQDLTGNIHFIKGDLHQSATTYGKKFRYKSVGSFFGSSEWIHKNFGNTPAACDIDIIQNGSILETRIILN